MVVSRLTIRFGPVLTASEQISIPYESFVQNETYNNYSTDVYKIWNRTVV